MNQPPPPSLDLGNLAALRVGDELCIVEPTANGVTVSAGVKLVHQIDAWRVLYRRPDRTVSGGAFHPQTGKLSPGMYPNAYYVSANPDHLARAKAQALAAQAEQERAKAARAALVAHALPAAQQLADPEDQIDPDGYRYNLADNLAERIADRLTPEQIATLRGWLGV